MLLSLPNLLRHLTFAKQKPLAKPQQTHKKYVEQKQTTHGNKMKETQRAGLHHSKLCCDLPALFSLPLRCLLRPILSPNHIHTCCHTPNFFYGSRYQLFMKTFHKLHLRYLLVVPHTLGTGPAPHLFLKNLYEDWLRWGREATSGTAPCPSELFCDIPQFAALLVPWLFEIWFLVGRVSQAFETLESVFCVASQVAPRRPPLPEGWLIEFLVLFGVIPSIIVRG